MLWDRLLDSRRCSGRLDAAHFVLTNDRHGLTRAKAAEAVDKLQKQQRAQQVDLAESSSADADAAATSAHAAGPSREAGDVGVEASCERMTTRVATGSCHSVIQSVARTE